MKKRRVRLTAWMMVFVLLAAFPAVPGSAASPQSGFSYSATPFLYKLVFNTAQKLADAVVFAVNAVFPVAVVHRQK